MVVSSHVFSYYALKWKPVSSYSSFLKCNVGPPNLLLIHFRGMAIESTYPFIFYNINSNSRSPLSNFNVHWGASYNSVDLSGAWNSASLTSSQGMSMVIIWNYIWSSKALVWYYTGIILRCSMLHILIYKEWQCWLIIDTLY